MTTVVRPHVIIIAFWWSAVAALAAGEQRSAPVAVIPSGNGLWDDLLGKCDGPRNTMDCVRSRMYGYVDGAFDGDFNVTDGLRFTRNGNRYETVCPDAASNDTGSAPPGAYREARARQQDDGVSAAPRRGWVFEGTSPLQVRYGRERDVVFSSFVFATRPTGRTLREFETINPRTPPRPSCAVFRSDFF